MGSLAAGALEADAGLGALALVVLLEDIGADALEQLLGEGAEERPGEVQRVEDGAALVVALGDELGLELAEELEVEEVLLAERLLSDDGLHGLDVLADGVVGVELVRDGAVVLARHALADGRLHQTGERRQHVDRRVDLAVVDLAVHVHLALRNVSRQIGDRVRDVVVGHRQNGDLRDGAAAALHAACALVDRAQIRVHVAGETTPAGHLLTRSRHLAQGVGVGAHVREDDQHVLLALVGEELGSGEG
mmetsp:Transcript_3162/g.11039  ORF Transcript_3162/g.11039 Transcript_3162/m.11039 type:complete len:248 (-) Transcript_3162:856-1599(-)